MSFVKEHRFHPTRRWSFDYAFIAERLAVEYEGGMFSGTGAKRCALCKRLPSAGHFAINRIKTDAEKYNTAATMNWAVIRVLPTMVDDGTAIETIKRALMVRRTLHSETCCKLTTK